FQRSERFISGSEFFIDGRKNHRRNFFNGASDSSAAQNFLSTGEKITADKFFRRHERFNSGTKILIDGRKNHRR
ncbi:MAG: hypothetical protein II902_06795, partial [Selenomonadaceae bacterium]|nr:hypothetical protein [Selenomonadaceae bacterium]